MSRRRTHHTTATSTTKGPNAARSTMVWANGCSGPRCSAVMDRLCGGWASAEVHVGEMVVGRRVERLLDRPRRGPPQQVRGGAGLVVGAGRARAAEGLLADDRAGRLVVDVEVAGGEAQAVLGPGHGAPVLRDHRAGQGVRREGLHLVD